MLDLTIAIPVKNEAKNLPECLEAIGSDFAAKVAIIDSGSTDATREIAESKGVEVIGFDWDGHFPKKRNWYLRNHPPKTKWVLFLDADEILTPEFKEELSKAIQRNDIVGYWLSYSIYFVGERLKGGYPLKKLALFRPDAGEYERIDESAWSHLDMEIHEHPVLEGQVAEIKAQIDHRDLRGVEAWSVKHAAYASWEAKRYLALTNAEDKSRNWTTFQKIKYRLMATPFLGPVFFLGSFFLMGGFKDGQRGFAWALLKCGYFVQIYSRIQEEKKRIADSG